jgi:hypothetical protein
MNAITQAKAAAQAKATPQSIGDENRNQILPTKNIDMEEASLPKYDFAAAVVPPPDINVRRGGSFGDVLRAAKGVAFYSDVIGFGQPSSGFTAGMPVTPIGINFFMPSGLRCSNGADMWTYFEGIPKGDALGTRIQNVIRRMGLPAMRGLAPGIIEDSKEALDPRPILQAAFGNVYPKCRQVSLNVGDSIGRTQDPENPKNSWIIGKVDKYDKGKPQQTKWIQDVDGKGKPIFITQREWNETPKTHNPDGTLKSVEKFEDANKASLLVAIVLLSAAFALTCRNR